MLNLFSFQSGRILDEKVVSYGPARPPVGVPLAIDALRLFDGVDLIEYIACSSMIYFENGVDWTVDSSCMPGYHCGYPASSL